MKSLPRWNALWAVPLLLLGLAGSASAQPVLNPGTGHYYELVPSTDIGWFAARHDAAQLSHEGLPGHLVTITSEGENNFLYVTFGTGSADALAWTGGWEPNDDGVWRWAAGPEAGSQYANGPAPVPPSGYVNWAGSEPNDFAANEDFMSYVIGGYSGFEGGWADSPEVNTGSDPIVGYLVEYEPALSSGVILHAATGKHYELVFATGIGWFAARDQAAQRSYLGVPGHLVTITSQDENDFLYTTFATGPTDALAWTGGWEPDDDEDWRWAVGPEAGVQYSSGASPVPPINYAHWIGSEPNDLAVDEDFMSYIIGGFTGSEGGWADSPEVNTGDDPIIGYLVEYETPVSGPGSIPPTLEVSLVSDTVVNLAWQASCGAGAVDYAIYEGELGNWYSHTLKDCTDDGGDLNEDVTPLPGNRYFLVVPHDDAGVEGSYGKDSPLAAERPSGSTACQPSQSLGTCSE